MFLKEPGRWGSSGEMGPQGPTGPKGDPGRNGLDGEMVKQLSFCNVTVGLVEWTFIWIILVEWTFKLKCWYWMNFQCTLIWTFFYNELSFEMCKK